MMERESVPGWVAEAAVECWYPCAEHAPKQEVAACHRCIERALLAAYAAGQDSADAQTKANLESIGIPGGVIYLNRRPLTDEEKAHARQLIAEWEAEGRNHGQRSASAAPAAGVDVEALSTAVPVAEHKWVGPMDPWCDKCGRDYLDARNQPCAKVNISKTCYPAVREDGPTRESERARLVAEVGECCLGSDPLCSDGCLVEHALAKRREARIPPAGAGAFRSEAGPTCHGCGLPSILGCDCPPAEQIVKDLRLIRSGQTVEYEWWKRTLDTAIAALASRLAPPPAEQPGAAKGE
jgi:hypothetical protein